ncbi:hypothetical protein QJS10_CPA16g00488 [Acorus calamus]|uniref:Uncharacterized protein n=1 Tax=Acorus calamus TaxID=4465 RepID=A0AAV9D2N8_ACOCL|nr:hypothetical protein QJS10_CPA16g00488 [Acorus calamus]
MRDEDTYFTLSEAIGPLEGPSPDPVQRACSTSDFPPLPTRNSGCSHGPKENPSSATIKGKSKGPKENPPPSAKREKSRGSREHPSSSSKAEKSRGPPPPPP